MLSNPFDHIQRLAFLSCSSSHRVSLVCIYKTGLMFLVRVAGKKERLYLGKFSQMCEPTHPPQAFCEILVKKANFRGDLFFFVVERFGP